MAGGHLSYYDAIDTCSAAVPAQNDPASFPRLIFTLGNDRTTREIGIWRFLQGLFAVATEATMAGEGSAEGHRG